jgi:hypothetical protein
MSEAEIKRANNCPNFMLTEDIITGREYTPRERKPREKQVAEKMQQLSFEEV